MLIKWKLSKSNSKYNTREYVIVIFKNDISMSNLFIKPDRVGVSRNSVWEKKYTCPPIVNELDSLLTVSFLTCRFVVNKQSISAHYINNTLCTGEMMNLG